MAKRRIVLLRKPEAVRPERRDVKAGFIPTALRSSRSRRGSDATVEPPYKSSHVSRSHGFDDQCGAGARARGGKRNRTLAGAVARIRPSISGWRPRLRPHPRDGTCDRRPFCRRAERASRHRHEFPPRNGRTRSCSGCRRAFVSACRPYCRRGAWSSQSRSAARSSLP